MTRLSAIFLLVFGVSPVLAEDNEVVHHVIHARLEPAKHRIEVTDRLENVLVRDGEIRFAVGRSLAVSSPDPDVSVRAAEGNERGGLRRYIARPAAGRDAWSGRRSLTLRLVGVINYPVEQRGDFIGGVQSSSGVISEKGVVLDGRSGWVAATDSPYLTFALTVDTPAGWIAVSQGERSRVRTEGGRNVSTWTSRQRMDEVYLIANRFHLYEETKDGVRAAAYLRSDDKALAERYIAATHRYVAMYSRLLGPYPYKKFALVENFWDTGFGMPSFTLLGPRVIRFPFIIYTSYPHEILHNWWGNSVYVDYARGNWCEGLTAYLADHMMAEARGGGAQHRFGVLKKYRNFVGAGRDFPLSAFRSRHSAATQAVGYGKALMVFHMLRRRLGDELFRSGLRDFYESFRFKAASWSDIRGVFERVGDRSLGVFFRQWIERTGAPSLTMHVKAGARTSAVTVAIRQTQEGEHYDLQIPLALTIEGRAEAKWVTLHMTQARQEFEVSAGRAILRIDMDPKFDLFRTLDRVEIPPSLGELFGARKILFVLPDATESELGEAWGAFARGWKRAGVDVTAVSSAKLKELPADRAVWVLGMRNRWRVPIQAALAQSGQKANAERTEESFTCAVRNPAAATQVLGWIASEHAPAFAGLIRKLPHYSKYSYVRFDGSEPKATEKGTWDAEASPLTWHASKALPTRATLPRREPLERAE